MMKYIIFPIIIALFCTACEKDAAIETSAAAYYHVKVDDAYLPVLVRGNTASNKILLFVQGGPGYPSIDFALIDYPKWKNTVEKDFAVAYYDQRGFGNKQGKGGMEKVTFAQYQEDLHQVAQFLKARYPDSELILFGYSFGASLSYHYLINYADRHVADKLISICGPWTHDGDNVKGPRWDFRRQYLLRISEKFIAEGKNVAYWQPARAWAAATNPIQSGAEMQEWNRYSEPGIIETDGKVTWKDYAKVGLFSHYNLIANLQYVLNDDVTSQVIAGEKATDIRDKFPAIKLPTLLISAEFDDQAPMEEISFIRKNIGSTSVSWRFFENTGHTVFLDAPGAFHESVVKFVGQ